MKLFGVSQSSGVERRLYVERGPDGIVLIIKDHDGSKERERILVQVDDLLSTITDPAPGGCMVEGVSQPTGGRWPGRSRRRARRPGCRLRPATALRLPLAA